MQTVVPNVVGQFVLSKDGCGFQEVVESLSEAKSVTVVTYNVAPNETKLLELLKCC